MTKLNKIVSKFEENGIDALLLFDEKNQFYFSEYKFSDGAILITKEKSYLITDFRYAEDANNKVNSDFEVIAPKAHLQYIKEKLSLHQVKNLGIEDETLSYSRYNRLSECFSGISFVGMSSSISEMRTVKSDYEVEKIKKAQKITDDAFSHILSIMTPSMTETEVALELEFYMRRNGADGIAFDTIAVSGSASALPHGVPRNTPLERGFLTMDFGATYDSYCADMTRTVCIGKADAEMKTIYNSVLEAQHLALDKIKAGELCSDVDKVARDYIDKNGYENCFGHSLGHGVGLYVHEAPRLSYACKEPLKAGHIVTVEPGIYLEGKYGCRTEDLVVVKENGCINLTKSAKDLIELF
jgi:Xaa-Pro aminopeptidase